MTNHKFNEDRGGIRILTGARRTTMKMNEQNTSKECLKTES
jgi:hypothetical protein